MKRYYWSFDESKEMWSDFEDSIERCIGEAKATVEEVTVGQDYVYIASSDDFYPSVDGENSIDEILNQANSECGEVSEGWLCGCEKLYDELSDILSNALNEWLEKIGEKPTFGNLNEIIKYDLKTGKIVA